MKRIIKTLALVLSVVMLFTCISVGFGSLTASATATDVFTGNVNNQQEMEEDCYKVSFPSWGWTYYNEPVDLTKGFYFTYKSETGGMPSGGGQWLRFYINNTSGSSNDSHWLHILYNGDGKLVSNKNGVNETIFGTGDKTHFVQAIPVVISGETKYKFAIDGTLFSSDATAIDENTFNELNNYKSETGEFGGCYLTLRSPISALVKLSFPTDDRYTGSADNNYAYTVSDYLEYDNIDLGFGGRATSTYTVNLLKGVEFGLDKLTPDAQAVDFVRMGFGADIWKIRSDNYEPTAQMAPSFEFANIGGKLAVSTFDGTAETDFVVLDTDIKAKHTVKAVAVTEADTTVYKFSVDGTVLDGIVLSETDFAALNNNGTGAYMGLYANNQDGAAFYEINPLDRVPTDVAFAEGVGPHTFPETDGVYTLTTPSWGSIKSTWRVDLLKGLKFKVNDVKDWVGLYLAGTYDVSTSSSPKFEFKNSGGKLLVAVRNSPDYVMLTGFDWNSEHTIWAKPVTENGVTVYEFYIDDIRIVGNNSGTKGNFTLAEESFKKINGYNTATDGFEGAYFCVQSSNTANIDLAQSLTAPELNYGDADGDGEIIAADLVLIRKYLLNLDLTDVAFDLTLADANNDGKRDLLDLIRIKKLIAKSVTE